MRVKKYIVNSMPDAMQQIRSELGNNAIILNTKKVKIGGWFGLFSKQQIEVIAAVDHEKKESPARTLNRTEQHVQKPALQEKLKSQAQSIGSPARPNVQGHIYRLQDEGPNAFGHKLQVQEANSDVQGYRLQGQEESPVTKGYKLQRPEERSSALSYRLQVEEEGSFVRGHKLLAEEGASAVQGHEPQVPKGDFPVQDQKRPAQGSYPAGQEQATQDVLLQELRRMQKVMSGWIMEKNDLFPEPVKELDTLLKNHELLQDIRSDILNTILSVGKEKKSLTSRTAVFASARSYLNRIVEQNQRGGQLLEGLNHAKILCFVGPTGVGKTTSIAKLAANLMLNEKKKVGFITSDTYRIAAVEQLRTYANIMQIPLEVVFSPEDLEGAMDRLQGCDIILMDTAGRNYKQQQYITELKELLSSGEDIQVHIVLSLTSKYEDQVSIMEQFKQINPNGLILTKADETHSYGSIINLLYQFSIPLAFMTNGQNVPDDLVLAQSETIVNLLLGEYDDEGSG